MGHQNWWRLQFHCGIFNLKPTSKFAYHICSVNCSRLKFGWQHISWSNFNNLYLISFQTGWWLTNELWHNFYRGCTGTCHTLALTTLIQLQWDLFPLFTSVNSWFSLIIEIISICTDALTINLSIFITSVLLPSELDFQRKNSTFSSQCSLWFMAGIIAFLLPLTWNSMHILYSLTEKLLRSHKLTIWYQPLFFHLMFR